MSEWKQEEMVLLLLSGNRGKSRLEWKVFEGSNEMHLFIQSIHKTSHCALEHFRQSVNIYGKVHC